VLKHFPRLLFGTLLLKAFSLQVPPFELLEPAAVGTLRPDEEAMGLVPRQEHCKTGGEGSCTHRHIDTYAQTHTDTYIKTYTNTHTHTHMHKLHTSKQVDMYCT
jgi:hypothetical protein